MKEIRLNQQGKNKGKYIALVDDEDYEYLNQFKWYANKSGNTFYAHRQVGSGVKKQKCIVMHRLIMHTPSGLEVDHINHNGLDNQKLNLRNCTKDNNGFNKIVNNKTGYAGVRIIREQGGGSIIAEINYQKKRYYLGVFKTVELAALARDNKAIELYGEFANLNFK